MKMWINGKNEDSCSSEYMEVRNPATGKLVDSAPAGCREDVDAAVEAAGRACGPWASLSPQERARFLYRAAGLVRERGEELALLLTSEQGKPLPEARNEIRGFASVLEYYCGLASTLKGEFIQGPGNGYSFTLNEPLGVCAAIIPWNMPALIMGWKLGPALVSGNTVVLKPASSTPLTNLKLASLLGEAGLPAGVLNLVTGPGSVVGEAIAGHPDIRKLSFTGESGTGKRVAALSAPTLKRLTLELGGSDPMIVCDDAELETAVDGVLRGRFYNCGQTCTAVKRLYLFDGIAEEFLGLLERRVRSLRVGNGMLDGINMGPLNNEGQQNYVAELVRGVEEREEGKILIGGRIPAGGGYSDGYFFEPTLISEVSPDSRLLTEEVFGPVLPVVRVQNLDEAIEEANRTKYGLGASVWTKNIDRVRQAYEQLKAGTVWVNQHLKVAPELPFGGTKESGLGRENGPYALSDYLESKTVMIRT
ncbi:aldehyde dehydrogenase family protein [Methanosarcina sp. Mfa9]|uniref:aldehyde dehydrogenase family protein n=1 Tax=Methanosarcina sp. Mfa9 TaxID=3439063 RepID=UPI003F86EFEA